MRPVLGREPGLGLAEVSLREVGFLVNGTGEKAHPERAPRYKTDPQFLAQGQHFLLGATPEHRILALHRREGQFGMGPAQGVQPHFGQAPVQDLALGLQILDGARHILNRHLGIHPVLVEQIDAVRAQALEHAFDGQLDMGRAADEARAPRASLQVDIPAELAGDHHLVAKGRDGFAENPLALVRAIGLGGVKKRDATLIGRADDVDHFRPRRNRRLVSAGHVLHAQTDTGNLQLPQLSPGTRLPGRGLRMGASQ